MVYVLYLVETGYGQRNEVIKKIEKIFNTRDMAHLYAYRNGGEFVYENYETGKSFWKVNKGETFQYVIEEFELAD